MGPPGEISRHWSTKNSLGTPNYGEHPHTFYSQTRTDRTPLLLLTPRRISNRNKRTRRRRQKHKKPASRVLCTKMINGSNLTEPRTIHRCLPGFCLRGATEGESQNPVGPHTHRTTTYLQRVSQSVRQAGSLGNQTRDQQSKAKRAPAGELPTDRTGERPPHREHSSALVSTVQHNTCFASIRKQLPPTHPNRSKGEGRKPHRTEH